MRLDRQGLAGQGSAPLFTSLLGAEALIVGNTAHPQPRPTLSYLLFIADS